MLLVLSLNSKEFFFPNILDECMYNRVSQITGVFQKKNENCFIVTFALFHVTFVLVHCYICIVSLLHLHIIVSYHAFCQNNQGRVHGGGTPPPVQISGGVLPPPVPYPPRHSQLILLQSKRH